MYATPPSSPKKQQKQPLAPLKINKCFPHATPSPKASRKLLVMHAECTGPVFLKNLLMEAMANRKLLQEIRAGVAKVLQDAAEHSSVLDLKITVCDEVISDLENMMAQEDAFPPPPPATPEAVTSEPAGGTSEKM
jgi:hypothetical protein